MLNRSRLLMVAFFSLALVTSLTLPALPAQDIILTCSDAAYTLPATTFGDGDTVYVEVTDNSTTTTGALTISVSNDQEANSISVSVTEGATYIYRGSFTITSGADTATALHMENAQTATITANLDGDSNDATKQITADYGITPLRDVIWTYSDSSRTIEETVFGDGETIYLKVTDTETKGGTKTITVENNQIGNTISINVTDSSQDSFYLGSFRIYPGENDDANDMLGLFDDQAATITVDLANDGAAATAQITADYAIPPTASITCDPSSITENIDVAVTLETSEDVTKVPTPLTITFSDDSTSDITLAGTVPGSTFTGSFTVTDDVSDGQATFSLGEGALVDADGDSGNTITSGETILIDRINPWPPLTLTAMATENDNIELTWTVPNEITTNLNLNQYNIYRGTDSGGQDLTVPIGTVTASAQSSYEWLDSNVVSGTTYYYVVRAQDLTGNESENSPEASAAVTTKLLSLGFQRPSVVRPGIPIEIILRVRQPASVNIRIFNLKGEIVYDWSEYISSGEEKEWTWNGVNMYGEEVNNGVYICKIGAQGNSGTYEQKIKLLAVVR